MDQPIAHNLEDEPRTSDVGIKTALPFQKMALDAPLLKGLQKAGYIYPTHIQAAAIPIGVTGIDLLIQSKAGTGKTLIFGTIIIQSYRVKINAPQALVIVPTREIALQIEDVLNKIGKYCKDFLAVSVIGGMDVTEDRKRLCNAKCVVGTPGRLLHLLETNVLNTTEIRLLVLDEADRMYSKSFRSDLQKIKSALTARRQIIACSATFEQALDKELAKIMRNPFLVSTEDRATVLLGIKQFVFVLPESPTSMHEMNAKLDALRYIFGSLSFKQSVLFASSQTRADSYCNYLTKDGWPCDLITAALSQKERIEIFRKFRAFKSRILLATDLMSRGVDSENVNLVINLELPDDVITYLHRIGRAGRFGSHGIAISFLCTPKDHRKFSTFMQQVGGNMPVYIFPGKDKKVTDEINFWNFEDNTHFDLFNMPKEMKCLAPLASAEPLTVSENQMQSNEHLKTGEHDSSIDTKTFQLDSKESAFNLCDLPDGNLAVQHLPPALNISNETLATTTTEQLPISSNTIDDASSIAADSLRSSQVDVSHAASEHGSKDTVAVKPATQNPFEKCLLQSHSHPKTEVNSQPVNLFDDYEAYMLKSDNDDSETETVEHKLNTEIMAKMATLLIDNKTNSAATDCIDPFEDYENFQVPEDTSISSTFPPTAKAQQQDVGDKTTFVLSVATPPNMPNYLQEFVPTADDLTDASTTDTTTEPNRVKHLPSPAHNVPVHRKKYRQMKLTINNVSHIAIAPQNVNGTYINGMDESTMPNSSTTQAAQSSYGMDTMANNVGSEPQSNLSINTTNRSNITEYTLSEEDDDDDDDELDNSDDEDYDEDEEETTANAKSQEECQVDEEDYDESDSTDNMDTDKDNTTDSDEIDEDVKLAECHAKMIEAYQNYNARMLEFIKYYRRMQKVKHINGKSH